MEFLLSALTSLLEDTLGSRNDIPLAYQFVLSVILSDVVVGTVLLSDNDIGAPVGYGLVEEPVNPVHAALYGVHRRDHDAQ